MSQEQTILECLGRGETLTVKKALDEHGIYALSQRCGSLYRKGYPILRERVTLPNGKRIATYRLERV
jgi:hypothetical protein